MEVPRVKELIDGVFKELAEETGPNPDCPFCGNKEWVRIGDGRVIEIRTVYEPRPVERHYVTGLGLQCSQCGFLRVHMFDPASWGLPAAGGE